MWLLPGPVPFCPPCPASRDKFVVRFLSQMKVWALSPRLPTRTTCPVSRGRVGASDLIPPVGRWPGPTLERQCGQLARRCRAGESREERWLPALRKPPPTSLLEALAPDLASPRRSSVNVESNCGEGTWGVKKQFIIRGASTDLLHRAWRHQPAIVQGGRCWARGGRRTPGEAWVRIPPLPLAGFFTCLLGVLCPAQVIAWCTRNLASAGDSL